MNKITEIQKKLFFAKQARKLGVQFKAKIKTLKRANAKEVANKK